MTSSAGGSGNAANPVSLVIAGHRAIAGGLDRRRSLPREQRVIDPALLPLATGVHPTARAERGRVRL